MGRLANNVKNEDNHPLPQKTPKEKNPLVVFLNQLAWKSYSTKGDGCKFFIHLGGWFLFSCFILWVGLFIFPTLFFNDK